MSNELKFLAYCIEIYKSAKKMNGEAVYFFFEKNNIFNYIKECYGALHTTSAQYIVDNIDEFTNRQTTELKPPPSHPKSFCLYAQPT